MVEPAHVFDRTAVRRHRRRAAPNLGAHDFLFREVAERLADRLDDLSRRFPGAVEIGSRGDHLARALRRRCGLALRLVPDPEIARPDSVPATVVADDELLPLAAGSFELVVSNLALHWTNDLPGVLVQIRQALRPDGLFLASLFGGRTLYELRESMMTAEIETRGGASPRVAPFADVPDAGSLLQRAGFALPVVDTDTISVTYTDAVSLMHDLRGMGETNAIAERRRAFTGRDVLARAAAEYAERFADRSGRIHATFQILYLTAWAPDPDRQQQALQPGSARGRLSDALGVEERPAGDKTPQKKG